MPNPIFNEEIMQGETQYVSEKDVMTINGTMIKSFVLLAFVVVSAAYTWLQFVAGNMGLVKILMYGGLFVGFVSAIIAAFAKKASPIIAPIYAVAEGFFLGGISAMYNAEFGGIVFQAITATFAVFFVMLGLFSSKVIVVTEKFRWTIIAATAAIGILYLVAFILSFFGINTPIIHDATPLGIAFSVVVVGIAAFNLLLDFDIIEKCANSMVPKYMEWYCSFALMVTLVWLYIEILRLLAKFYRSRD